ncbi:MAG: hypothetical protein RMJ81_02915 [Candidatus Kryptonium sp.]|nr:hypothetical protein [Candidatus Kryptonium sp.]MCX7762989.1 hypothetical protein [Candidatus Kryptonium sp.]MDW8108590.1 hypothetical protein [Candidatus Kryptonium sp.]
MTTKAPSPIKEFPADSPEKIAYSSVENIPAEEPNDINRLGYHVWLYLTGKVESLEMAVKMARARLHISEEEAIKIIKERLKEKGF